MRYDGSYNTRFVVGALTDNIASDYCRMIAIHSRAYLLLNSVCTLIVTAMSLHSNTTLISVLRNTCTSKAQESGPKSPDPLSQ